MAEYPKVGKAPQIKTFEVVKQLGEALEDKLKIFEAVNYGPASDIKLPVLGQGSMNVVDIGANLQSVIAFQSAILKSDIASDFLDNEMANALSAVSYKLEKHTTINLLEDSVEHVMEKFSEILKGSGYLQTDATNLGMFLEKAMFGVTGGGHIQETGDIEGIVEIKLGVSAKGLGKNVDSYIRALQFTPEGFKTETMIDGEKKILASPPEQIFNPSFRITAAMSRLIEKMASMLYFHLDLNKTDFKITALWLFSVLWLENILRIMLKSYGVKISTTSKAAEIRQDYIATYTYLMDITFSHLFGDNITSEINKYSEIYLRRMNIYDDFMSDNGRRGKMYGMVRHTNNFFGIRAEQISDVVPEA